MKKRRWVIASRQSRLALIQAQLVRDQLQSAYPALVFELRGIKTAGDKIPDAPLSKIGIQGLFTKEIEETLLRGEVDIAVHSMKDLPVAIPEGLRLAAVSRREDPRDALVSREGFILENLPKGAKIGTSSLRRSAQLLHLRRDLQVADLRGNLDTRVKKMEQGLYVAIVLACAGIKRLGLNLRMSPLPIDQILPQAGQGALGMEIRCDDREAENLTRAVDDPETHSCVEAERSLLLGLGGGCQLPIGVYARLEHGQIFLKAGAFSPDGKAALYGDCAGAKEDGRGVGRKLAGILLKQGARQVLIQAH